jgi:hypothetical protein
MGGPVSLSPKAGARSGRRRCAWYPFFNFDLFQRRLNPNKEHHFDLATRILNLPRRITAKSREGFRDTGFYYHTRPITFLRPEQNVFPGCVTFFRRMILARVLAGPDVVEF